MEELLLGAPRRAVERLERLDELEGGAEHGHQRGRVVAAHRQATALPGTSRAERGHHEVAARSHGIGRPLGVRRSVGRLGEEVERRSVVPDSDGLVERDVTYVGDVERHRVAAVAQQVPEAIQRDR